MSTTPAVSPVAFPVPGAAPTVSAVAAPGSRPAPLYTPEQRRRRDASPWTLVQGVLAPLQFLVFAVSTVLVARFLLTGAGWDVAAASVLVKTVALLAIMVTGACWERAVFGVWLFAPAFFWEDVFSFAVIALHVGYVASLWFGLLPHRALMLLALSAYAAYLVNATQFLLKLSAARRDAARPTLAAFGAAPGARP